MGTAASQWAVRFGHLRQRRWFRWGLDLVILIAVLALANAWQTRSHLRGGQAPSAVATTLEGERVSLESLRGKPVLLAFWAPWCKVCAAESQNLSWARRFAGDRAQVLSVAASFEDLGQVRAYARDHAVDYPVLLGGDPLAQAFRVEAFPTIYFIDADGRIKGSTVGYTTTAGLLLRLFL